MAVESTYQPGTYRKQGGNTLVVGPAGRLASGAGVVAAQNPSTGTLSAHTTSATLTGNDFAGTISIVTDATGTATGVSLFIVTFANVRATAPIVHVTNLSPGASSTTAFAGSYGAIVTTTGFTVVPNALLTASSTLVLGYTVVDVE